MDLLRLLADGREHSGEALANELAVTRAAVWKQVQQLTHWGLEVEATPGRGYRLARPLDLLDAPSLCKALPGMAGDRLRTLVVADEIESTNQALLAVDDLPPGRFDVCLAEFQTRGRGRRGREWLAPFGSGICLSLNWCFEEAPPQLAALSLAVGVAIRRALAACGVHGTGLKWPNDILVGLRKLGGVLVELRFEAAGPAYAVVGVGLNTSLHESSRTAILETGLEVTSLHELGLDAPPGRTELAAALVGSLAMALDQFEREGFAPFAEEWRAADALRARPARVQRGEEVLEGTARGIDPDGALLLEVDGRISRFVSGEVSVRPAA